MVDSWVSDALRDFGRLCKAKLAGPGDREAAIRSPLEQLLTTAGGQLGVRAVFYDEVRDTERRVRPDYAVSIEGAIGGYVEVKAPGKPVDPKTFTGHDRQQWERQRDLPNLLYTNGTEWRLFRDGEAYGAPVYLTGGTLDDAGEALTAQGEGFEGLVTQFLRWRPAPITSVAALVKAVAPLTRLLRGEVLDQMELERRRVATGEDTEEQPFLGLARDWRDLLFPNASDDVFADGYAQTVTFALLLARTEGITLGGRSLHTVGRQLGVGHSLMGNALQLLTDRMVGEFQVTLDLLVRVVDQVQWDRVRRGRRDTYLHLYERFLDEYDPELRKQSGSYYTPREVVEEMVRLTEDALTTRLGVDGFADPAVLTVDPAMGTGTYLHTIIERVANRVEAREGPGAVPGTVQDLAKRLVGFELQMNPYAVAELRATDLLRDKASKPPKDGLRFYVTNTLDDPYEEITQLSSSFGAISRSRRRANEVKAKTPVTVVIGNPPYKELAVGEGGWVEQGGRDQGDRARPILEDYFDPEGGRFKAKLKNLYIYFWRWATWKVWETTPQVGSTNLGVVCFISTSGYLTGPAFTVMREHLRRHASEGWIIDLTPEGQTPDVPTRVFPGVRQPLAIGLFVRRADTDHEQPATIHYRPVRGRQAEKFAALAAMQLDDDDWRAARTDWDAPFTPAAVGGWDQFPALEDLMPWYSPGVFPTRTWVYAPSADILRQRWRTLSTETDRARQAKLFKEGRDATLNKAKPALPGTDTHQGTGPLRNDRTTKPTPIRMGYRSFDRQWVLPDARLMDMPRRDLWAARVPGQVFVVEQHRKHLKDGPGLVFTALIPDFDHFKGSEGGRAFPFMHPDTSPNLAPGLTTALAKHLGVDVEPIDVLAYIASLTAHPGFTQTFVDELTTPGVRVPITADTELWQQAVELGRQVLWLHTYGQACADPAAGRPVGDIRLPASDPQRPLATRSVTGLPKAISYDSDTQVVAVGEGRWGPVRPEVWKYTVGGRNVIKSWFNYRKAEPGGKRSSPLDELHETNWPTEWTTEFTDLLSVLTRLVNLESDQSMLLEQVLEQPVLTSEELARRGTQWPRSRRDRIVRMPLQSEDGTLDLSDEANDY